jgi:hypothetical protein
VKRRLTRRRALAETITGAGGLALALAGCGGGAGALSSAAGGSTLRSTWRDPVGDGQLRVGPGEPFVPRVELGAQAGVGESLATLAHVTDAHVMDASSPARVSFLDRLGSPSRF